MKSANRFRLGAVPKGLIILFCVIGLLLSVGGALLVGTLGGARDSVNHQIACRNNLANLSKAAILYDQRMGKYPGYMNTLRRTDGSVYVNPTTMQTEPVSWAVELLADLDRMQLYEQWRANPPTPVETRQPMMEIFVCPLDPAKTTPGRLCYVANSGMRDAPSSTPATSSGGSGGFGSVGIPRDWQANGMFFDNYSDDPLIKTKATQRGPQIVMRSGQIRDPKDRTIMFIENTDATKYVFERSYFSAGASQAEIVWGCNWGVGAITPVGGNSSPPSMTPPADLYRPNEAVGKASPELADYKYCRPSSKHSGGFNVAFANGQVAFLSDRISYFIYAKLMASDDSGAKMAGTQTTLDPTFRGYQMNDADLNP